MEGQVEHVSLFSSIQPWVAVDDYVMATAEITRATVEALQAQRVKLALPQREVRLLNAPV